MAQKVSFIVDNVLPKDDFKKYQTYLQNTSVYRVLEADGNKKFYITDVPFGLQESVVKTLTQLHNNQIEVNLAVVRKATSFLDKEWGIHADWNVGTPQAPDYGAVMYISQNTTELNGTALWRHKQNGYAMPSSFSIQEKKAISEKSYHDIEDWEISSVIGGIENRLFAYPAEYFHSKFPKQAWGTTQKDSRLILALFYNLV